VLVLALVVVGHAIDDLIIDAKEEKSITFREGAEQRQISLS